MQRFTGYATATIFLVFSTFAAGRLAAAPIPYILMPGSTISPVDGATPTGPTENLTGYCIWQLESNGDFQCTALNFQSPSTTFTLSTQYTNQLIYEASNNTIYFQEAFADTGLWNSQVSTVSAFSPGTYQGPSNAPTSLDFPNMGLSPSPSGGLWAGWMTLVADPALPGDANLDGQVDVNDLTILLTNFGRTGATWTQGEFTGDGTVDVNDLTILLTNFGQTLSASAGSAAAVPEPCAAAPAAAALAGLLAYSCRKRKQHRARSGRESGCGREGGFQTRAVRALAVLPNG